jgi:hypothetical protein
LHAVASAVADVEIPALLKCRSDVLAAAGYGRGPTLRRVRLWRRLGLCFSGLIAIARLFSRPVSFRRAQAGRANLSLAQSFDIA